MRARLLLLIAGAGFAAALAAHEGEPHGAAPADEASTGSIPGRPRRDADGALWIDKALQRRLGLRTVTLGGGPVTRSTSLVGEIVARPDSAQKVVATEAGTLEAPDGGWPLPGRAVQRGEVLAWLRPALNERERAERRAQVADLDQKLVIAELTVERMRLQRQGVEDTAAQGNVYYEQSVAERDAMLEQRRLLLDSLEGRQALRAAIDGRLTAVRVAAGQVAPAGGTLFEIAGRGGLRVIADSFDSGLATRLREARLEDGSTLSYRGFEPLADGAGWRLLFDLPAIARLQPGQLARISVSAAAEAGEGIPSQVCVLDSQGHAQLWVHAAAERFVSWPLAGDCGHALRPATLAADARVVTEGAALLSLY